MCAYTPNCCCCRFLYLILCNSHRFVWFWEFRIQPNLQYLYTSHLLAFVLHLFTFTPNFTWMPYILLASFACFMYTLLVCLFLWTRIFVYVCVLCVVSSILTPKEKRKFLIRFTISIHAQFIYASSVLIYINQTCILPMFWSSWSNSQKLSHEIERETVHQTN